MRYFIADLHIGHENVAKRRFGPDLSIGEASALQTEMIFDRIAALTKSDDLWILGDLTNGSRADEKILLRMLAELKASKQGPGSLHLIAGNHDSVSPIHRRSHNKQKEFLEVFDSVQHFAKLTFNKQEVMLCHFPYANLGDGPGRPYPGRYNEHRLPNKGLPLIHGHTHQSTPHTRTRTFFPQGFLKLQTGVDYNQYCVSFDVHYDLVSDVDIEQWLERRKHLRPLNFHVDN